MRITLRLLACSYVLLASTFLLSSVCEARLATDADLASLVEIDSASFDVKKDGSFTVDIETQTLVLTEAGREAEAVQNISFNARASTFELLSAKTVNDSAEVKVPKENIEIFCAGRVYRIENFTRLRTYGQRGFGSSRLWRQDKGQSACASAFIQAIRSAQASPIPAAELFEVTRATFQIKDQLK